MRLVDFTIDSNEDSKVIIRIADKLRIHGTENSYQLERPRHRHGQVRWEAFKYFSTFRQALAQACQREIRVHPANTLADAIEAADAIAARYGQLLDCALDEIGKHDATEIRLAS